MYHYYNRVPKSKTIHKPKHMVLEKVCIKRQNPEYCFHIVVCSQDIPNGALRIGIYQLYQQCLVQGAMVVFVW